MDLTMSVPGQLESIFQLEQATAAVLSVYQNYSVDAKQQAMMDKTTFAYIHNSCTIPAP
jgi:hypothetical protein